MSTPGTFLDALVHALRAAATYNRGDQVPPAAVLWTDQDRRWEALLPLLRAALPILTLGTYQPAARTGPAIWLRCMIARMVPDADWPADAVPIIYLPGVSRPHLRAVETCPRHLQPLAELQYRGVLWSHRNGKDWTPAAFLQSTDGGLGVEVANDLATRDALQLALVKLAGEPIADLQGQTPLSATYFRNLVEPDPVRSILLWMNDPHGAQGRMQAEGTWIAFQDICRTQYGVDPVADGPVRAAELLGKNDGPWATVWQRFVEAPTRYGQLPNLLRRAQPAQSSFFEHQFPWPQANEEQESMLRTALRSLPEGSPAPARTLIAQLEQAHGKRRGWVWAELGQAPLAQALAALVRLADATGTPLSGDTPHAVANAYAERGWHADAAVIDALAAVERTDDALAVKHAVRALYEVWLRDGAEKLQAAVQQHGWTRPAAPNAVPGRCFLFADGLRYDVGQRLAEALAAQNLPVQQEWRFAALPTVTPTAKPAAAPVAEQLGTGSDFTPTEVASGTKVTIEVLRRVLEAQGIAVLKGDDTGTASGAAWTEYGSLDSLGHAEGWKLAHRVGGEVRALADRIVALLDAGWQSVQIVTDHGWLLLPGGLPTATLPLSMTEARKGRCARLKPTADTADQQTVAWHWDTHVQIALAPGIACYEAGKEYEHGGLSPQECVVPVLTVARGALAQPVTIETVTWRNLRCSVQLRGAAPGTVVDIRTKPGASATSIVMSPKEPAADGTVSLVVADEDLLETAAYVVVLAADGSVHTQRITSVGGEQ